MADHPFDLLGAELRRAALRRSAPAVPWWRRVRWLGGGVGVALGVSAAAWAATSLLSSGDPVPYRYGAQPSPDRHYGITVAGSVRMLAGDVPDPDGGLPWGLRSFTTSRGFGCIQVGRVQEGKLGVLALERKGGGLVGRGRFHELRPAPSRQATACVPLDGAGHTFVAWGQLTTPGVTIAPCRYRGTRPVCRGRGLRAVDAGLLGPHATSLTLRGGDRVPLLGADHGYLVVRRAGHRPSPGAYATTPASPALAVVRYGARTCTVRATNQPRGACGAVAGFAPIAQPAPQDVRARVRAFAAPDRRGMRVRFRARAAVRDGRSTYAVTIHYPGGHQAVSVQLERNVHAGQLVRTTVDLPSLGLQHRPALHRGVYRVDVSYRALRPYPGPWGSPAAPGYRVGTARVVVR